jgi:hypothetical protein
MEYWSTGVLEYWSIGSVDRVDRQEVPGTGALFFNTPLLHHSITPSLHHPITPQLHASAFVALDNRSYPEQLVIA